MAMTIAMPICKMKSLVNIFNKNHDVMERYVIKDSRKQWVGQNILIQKTIQLITCSLNLHGCSIKQLTNFCKIN